jgi:hypothetical protein
MVAANAAAGIFFAVIYQGMFDIPCELVVNCGQR